MPPKKSEESAVVDPLAAIASAEGAPVEAPARPAGADAAVAAPAVVTLPSAQLEELLAAMKASNERALTLEKQARELAEQIASLRNAPPVGVTAPQQETRAAGPAPRADAEARDDKGVVVALALHDVVDLLPPSRGILGIDASALRIELFPSSAPIRGRVIAPVRQPRHFDEVARVECDFDQHGRCDVEVGRLRFVRRPAPASTAFDPSIV